MLRRPAYLAGQWYPSQPNACREAIAAHARSARPEQGEWRGLIGPHAGWYFSGDAAARTYAWLARARPDADLVVVFGSHRGPEGPNTVFRGDVWETPLGDLDNHRALADGVAQALPLQDEPVTPRHADNGVELHLPFVRYFFPQARLLMLGVAAAPAAVHVGEQVATLSAAHARNPVFVGSTDLTHYGPNYGFEPHGRGAAAVGWVRRENDRRFIDAVLAGDEGAVLRHGVETHGACCPGAAAATLAAVRTWGAREKPKLVDHYLSCDVQPNSSFVGYAGIIL
ncbi:MAG: AmmeMemoRadiSam system protein B [Deltaproteobacteria bacterium]|nr:AmmeMemoRadiSam system protein B [Deltaproteobacteria bacterium]